MDTTGAEAPGLTLRERRTNLRRTVRCMCEVFRASRTRFLTVPNFEQAWEQIIGDEFPGCAAGSPSVWATVRLLELRGYVRVRRHHNRPWDFTMSQYAYVQVDATRPRIQPNYIQNVHGHRRHMAMLATAGGAYDHSAAGLRPSSTSDDDEHHAEQAST